MAKYSSVKRLSDRLVFGLCGFALCVSGCDSAVPEKSSNVGQKQLPAPLAESRDTEHVDFAEEDWSQFRGPNFSSTTSLAHRVEWALDNGVEWKSELPGRGAATPILVGDRIFVTAFDGFGLTVENAGELKDLRHHLLCFDKNTGQPVWQREVTGTSLLQKMNPELVRHGFASSTPVSDGQNVYVFFGVTGVFAFDLNGELLWQRNLGLETHYFGSSSSPIVYGDLLIVNASIESDTIYALDKNTGACVWTIPKIRECWSTPVIGKNAQGVDEMVVSSKDIVAGYDPTTGKQLWRASGILDYVVSVPIIVEGVCYLTGGKTKQTMAIRLGGSGDVTESHKLWEVGKIGSNVSSPVFRDGKLFIFHDSGVVQVLDASNGAVLNRHRTATRERPFASPLLAGEHLYMPFQDAGISVFTADEDCVEVATNECGEGLPLMASVVPSGDRLYFRTDRFLYCVGPENKATVEIAWETVSDHDVVKTIESFNIDPKKGWSRRYLGFLTPNFEKAIKFLLMPYQSVITDEQTTQARDIIMAEKPKYDALREQYEMIRDEELTTAADQSEKFHERYAQLEADTKALNSETRILVKKLFPKEQMQQHLEDAKDGKAHLKPDSDKKTKKKS
ncbi:MAG: PQQ-binding-like beta-propeller repeat protein [Pirellulaceae bacterium]|nr:PQQ-binding-like beta-propeller repeat protein [Pirellulaceae bacterium]